MRYGYHGQYLRIDLSSGATRSVGLSEGVLRRYIGGVGLGCYILLREEAAACDPLAPEATLVFSLSPLVGSPLTTSAKFAVVSKSPLTQRLNDSLASSGFALAAKKTGHDAIAILGRADKQSVVVIDNDTVTIKAAEHLSGLTCSETTAVLEREYGKEFQVAMIGPAGEQMVRYATISHDGRHAGRGGAGAVLGSKNIKAVLVRGEQRCAWAEPQQLSELAKTLSQKSFGPATAKYRELGTATNLLLFNRLHALPTRNFQTNSFAAAERIAPERLSETRNRTRASCVACTIGCEHIYDIAPSPGDNNQVRVEYENLFAFGSLCCIENADDVLQASKLCDELGIDTISAGGTISFAMECVERGLLAEPWLRFGDATALSRALHAIATRQGIGNSLAEGSRWLATHIGQESIAFAPQVKGLEIPGYDPRALQHMALGFAVGTRGADHNRSSAYEADFSGAGDRHQLTAASADRAVASEDRATLMDSLILCKFVRGVFQDLFAESADMLRLITGWDVSSEELQETTQRIISAKKLFNIRAGWQPAEDTLPARFFDQPPLDRGAPTIDAEALQSAIHCYNLARGWTKHGWLTEAALQQVGISE